MALDPDVRRRLSAAARKAESWRRERDELILLAHTQGGTLREIAELAGLSNPAVLHIVRRDGPRNAPDDAD